MGVGVGVVAMREYMHLLTQHVVCKLPKVYR